MCRKASCRIWVASGQLVQVLDDWSPMFPGYYLYYPVPSLVTGQKKRTRNGRLTPSQLGCFVTSAFPRRFGASTLLKFCAHPITPTLAEAAMRYVLSAPEPSTLIPGMTNKAEVDMNVGYSDGQGFPPELLAALPEHIWARNFYQ